MKGLKSCFGFLVSLIILAGVCPAQAPAGFVGGVTTYLPALCYYTQGTPVYCPSGFNDSGIAPFYGSFGLTRLLPTTAISLTKTANATSVTCNTAACTNNKGIFTLVGGTATTGTVVTVAFTNPVSAIVGHSGSLGTGYVVGDTLTYTCTGGTNAVGKVATIGASGAIGTVSVTTAGNTCLTASAASMSTSGAGTGATFDITANAPVIPTCFATQNGGAAFQGIGNSVPTSSGFNITAGVTVNGATVVINYECKV